MCGVAVRRRIAKTTVVASYFTEAALQLIKAAGHCLETGNPTGNSRRWRRLGGARESMRSKSRPAAAADVIGTKSVAASCFLLRILTTHAIGKDVGHSIVPLARARASQMVPAAVIRLTARMQVYRAVYRGRDG